jgi:hypothetical protein
MSHEQLKSARDSMSIWSIYHTARKLDQDKTKIDYVEGFFDRTSDDMAEIDRWAQKLMQTQQEPSSQNNVERLVAREQYSDLNHWNRELHSRLVNMLEPTYLGLASRVINYATNHQDELQKMSSQIKPTRLSYRVASLPPNLFDHRDSRKPFIPETDEAIALLVSEFNFFNSRLMQREGVWPIRNRHALMDDSPLDQSMDIMRELQRRRNEGDQTFATEEGRMEWRRYSHLFKVKALNRRAANMSLHQNATFISYGKNRDFTETGGFFEMTDGVFQSFFLADLYSSDSVFTSQIRVPIGRYGTEAARDLTLGTYMMMRIISKDAQFTKEIKAIAHDPATRPFLQQHLMRSKDSVTQSDAVEYGILQTAIEGTASISAVFAAVEADGVPGYEDDVWGGISAILDADLPLKVTAVMPQAVVVPMTLHGNYFRNPLVSKDQQLRIRPEVAYAWQKIHDRRTAAQHAAWSTYRQSGEGNVPPVRFGLHCPFKGEVVREFSEALIICRAIAHES